MADEAAGRRSDSRYDHPTIGPKAWGITVLNSPATAHFIRDIVGEIDAGPDFELTDSHLADLTWVDGMLTASAVGPKAIEPREWIDAYYGKDYDHREEAVVAVLMRMWKLRHDHILHELQDARGSYKPDFIKEFDPLKVVDRATDWSHGFLRGVRLRHSAWSALQLGTAAGDALATITMYLETDGEHPIFGNAPRRAIETQRRNALADFGAAIDTIYAFWGGRARAAGAPPDQGLAGKVGRNDPCPCGSGEKYKRCCLY